MPAFSGTLNPNEIFSSIFNMIISQQVNADNIKEGFASLVNRARVDGGLYGDTKLYYDTDVLKSHAWGGDSEATNLLAVNRPDDPECQAIYLNIFRQIDITVDYYLSKRAWKDEYAFSSFTSVTLGWLRDTKKVYDQTTYNTFIGVHKSPVQADRNVTLSTITAPATTADEESLARLRAQKIGKAIADLMIEMKDVSRDFNDYNLLKEKCDTFLEIKRMVNDIQIVSGGARGADSLGERYAAEKGYHLQLFNADWEKYGKSAGYKRNVEMAENAGMPLPGQRGRKAPKLPAGDEITLKDTGLAPKSVKKKITPRNMRKAR